MIFPSAGGVVAIAVGLVFAALWGTACSLDSQGLGASSADAGKPDAASDSGPAGTGGRAGTGTGGGAPVTGTGGGIGLDAGTGGMGEGGAAGTGGRASTGGNLGTGGGNPATGGANPGTGGDNSPGTGGTNPGTGGAATGGAATGGGGTGGAATGGVGTGGRMGTGGAGTGGAAPTCNANNCANGCCNGTTCVTNRTNMRCGPGGAACAPCGACYQCSDASGACALSPGARWDVLCASATFAPTKPGNVLWDSNAGSVAGALPDAYCQFTLEASGMGGGQQGRTSLVMDSLAPVWNQSLVPSTGTNITYSLLSAQPTRWSVSVIDDDGGAANDDTLCTVTPRLTAADFAAGAVTFPATQSCNSLTLHLVCAQ
ncbi:MAG: C2 domain-containing protein [Bacteroidota bacterium]